MAGNTDSWDGLLDLEDRFHREGYDLGLSDGKRAGQAEGRQFGMIKAMSKFLPLGYMNGRAEILQERTMSSKLTQAEMSCLTPLSTNARFLKHLERLMELTDVQNVPTENSEEAVEDIDERLRDASSRSMLIAKVTGEDMSMDETSANRDELEDFEAKTRFDVDAT